MDKEEFKKDVMNLWDIQDKITKVVHFRYEGYRVGPYTYNKDISKAVKLFKIEGSIKERIRKNIGLWKYVLFILNDVYFYGKFTNE